MIKKKISGMSKKEQLEARAKNRLYNFMLEDGQIRGAVIHGTHMIKEMRVNHETGILETLVLGHAYIGISLMTANLKERGDQIAFKIECSGPIKGLSVEANTFGEVRGYLKNNPISIEKPLENFDLAPFFGEGFLMITRFPQYARQPYVGHIKLKYGSIAKDLAHYFSSSEQAPTAFHLSVKFDPEGNVTGAGGLLLQTMPGTDHKRIDQLEHLMHNLYSIGEAFSVNQPAEEYILQHFHSFSPKVLDSRRIEFFCRCRKAAIGQIIAKLPVETLEDIFHKGPFPVETRCHNCNTVYQFDKGEIEKFLKKGGQGK
jgi:molecular chaperone Hsp33